MTYRSVEPFEDGVAGVSFSDLHINPHSFYPQTET